MKKRNIVLKNIVLTIFIFGGFIACDKDFASLDSDVINPDNAINFSTDVEEYPIITYNHEIGPVRTNGLSSYLLGYSFDPVFGASTSNFVSQISPSVFDPTFGDNIVLDSVILTVPYFSRLIETDSIGNGTYEIDSIFGNTPIKLSIFENNYFLRDFDLNSEFSDKQKYFSNRSTSETNFISPSELEGELFYENDQFLPRKEEIILTVIDTTTNEPLISNRLAPAIRVNLYDPDENDTFWQNLIFDKEVEPELSNLNNFLNYFRGIYFKVESADINGTLMMLDFTSADANITLYYTSDVETETDTDTEATQEAGTYILNFIGNQVNFFDNNFFPIPTGDEINGDEKLFLKGGEGFMAIINLFNGDDEGNSPEFEEFKNNYNENGTVKRLINEAYLEFYVDQTTVQSQEPDRLYIFDLNNNITLIDYVFDQSVNETTTKLDHLVPLQRVDDDPDGQGIKYKIRITQHLNNLAFKDSTNVKLGLVVTTNVASINNFELQDQTGILKSLVSGEILSPRSTVLHGNNTPNQDKKVTFKIYYTEPDN
ncbi:DUF4270 domain-containing protein [Flavobacteriaceae bacterium PRS1]|nr:DUF4270 domain-containing protein [Flavobacteriaceae bacterium PRS1]